MGDTCKRAVPWVGARVAWINGSNAVQTPVSDPLERARVHAYANGNGATVGQARVGPSALQFCSKGINLRLGALTPVLKSASSLKENGFSVLTKKLVTCTATLHFELVSVSLNHNWTLRLAPNLRDRWKTEETQIPT